MSLVPFTLTKRGHFMMKNRANVFDNLPHRHNLKTAAQSDEGHETETDMLIEHRHEIQQHKRDQQTINNRCRDNVSNPPPTKISPQSHPLTAMQCSHILLKSHLAPRQSIV